MAIPVRAIGTVSSISNLVSPIMQFVREEIDRVKEEITVGTIEVAARQAPTHVGMGLRIQLDSTHKEGNSGFASDFDARLDLLSLPIDPNSSSEPAHPTPAVQMRADLRVYDADGEQDWLYGGPLEPNRLRSMEAKLKWSSDGWDADIILEDAAKDGVVDWSGRVPGRMNLSSSQTNVDLGFGETVLGMLEHRKLDFVQPGCEADAFLRTLEMIEIAVPPSVTDGSEAWTINEINLTTLCQNPTGYLTPMLCDSNGDWNLAQTLQSGQTILAHLCARLPFTEFYDNPDHPRYGQLGVRVPIRSIAEGAKLYLHPHGYLELDIKQFPLGRARLSANIGLDIAGAQPSSSSDGITLTVDARLDLTDKPTGLFSGSYIHAVFDENLPASDQLIIDLHLPRMGKILAPLDDLNTASSGQSTWISTSDSVRLHPPPTVAGQSLGDFLSTTSPTVILDMLTRLTVDAYVLSRVEGDSLLGEVMEVLDLVDQQSDGRYTCASLLDFIRAPKAYLESIFILNGGVRVSKVLQLSGAFMRAFDLPHYEVENTSTNETEAVVFELGCGDTSVFAEIAVMVHSQDPNGVSVSFRSPASSTTSPLEIAFDIRANLTPGPVFDIDGSSITLTARPNDLILDAGGTTSVFAQGSEISVIGELIQGTVHLSMDVNIDGINTSHLTLLPTVSGFASLLNSVIDSVLPRLMTLLLKELRNVTFGSSNQHNLGDILIDFFYDIDLWGPNPDETGAFLEPEVAAIAADPRRWLMGFHDTAPALFTAATSYNQGDLVYHDDGSEERVYKVMSQATAITGTGPTHTSGQQTVCDVDLLFVGTMDGSLEDVLIGGVRAISTIVFDSISSVTVTSTTTAPINTVEITIGVTNPTFDVTIEIGRRSTTEFGIWVTAATTVTFSTTYDGDKDLSIGLTGGCLFELQPFSVLPSINLEARMLDAFATSSSLRIKPAVSFSWDPANAFVLQAATDYRDSDGWITWFENQEPNYHVNTNPGDDGWFGSELGFWVRWESGSNGGLWKGMPDLEALILGALDVALGFIENIPVVQEWLDEIYLEVGGTPLEASRPGTIAIELQLMSLDPHYPNVSTPFDPNHCPKFVFDDVKTILDTWRADPVGCILNAIFGLLEVSISAQLDNRLTVFEKDQGEFKFKISIVDADSTSGSGIFGIAFEFEDPPEIELGKLRLQLFTQDSNQLNAWVDRSPNDYNSGIAFYFVEWDSTNGVTPHLSLELGGIGARLFRSDGKPILDKFLMLNAVEVALALDVNILNAVSQCANSNTGNCSTNCVCCDVEFGAQLTLDDFGIELGGGDSDGGNGMAKGLLSGGEDGKDPVKPMFDISISKYHDNSIKLDMKGELEYWFPVNKKFGPVNIAQIGVIYEHDTTNYGSNDPLAHRLSIVVDGEAEVAGFLAQVDDLGVNFPILRPFEFDDWKFELKGLAISFTKGDLSIAGALRKEDGHVFFSSSPPSQPLNFIIVTSSDQDWANIGSPVGANWAAKYVEYQGLCTITTSTLGLSAIGAFARVPKEDGSGFVSCFVIAALNMPLGGPPMFFINGLMGGIGINRELLLPDISNVPQNLFIQALSGSLADDPMGALEQIRTTFPVEHGTFWLAVGLKFTSFKVVETKAVLFVRFGDGFTIGLLGLSTLDLPDASMRIACIELAIMAYYDSGENVLWVQAQLTDNSYLFSTSCRLTGGFALVVWFNTGDFVLSLGGYHPSFSKPSHYPTVPRLGFNWTPISALTIKGGVYFTLCSSAVMLGGGLDASYKKGKLKATFMAGMDILIIFDPFEYNFRVYINVSVKYGRLGASLGADLEIMGPKMHGKARIELLFVKFTVKFGPWDNPPQLIPFQTFINRHVRQLDDDDANINSWFGGEEWFTASVTEGAVQSQGDEEEGPTGDETDPWIVNSEFNINIQTKYPNKQVLFPTQNDSYFPTLSQLDNTGYDLDGNETSAEQTMHLAPVGGTSTPITNLYLEIADPSDPYPIDTNDILTDGLLGSTRTIAYLAATLWSSEEPESGAPPKAFLNGAIIQARAIFSGVGDEISFDGNIEPCEFNMHLPLVIPEITAILVMLGQLAPVQVPTATPEADTNSKFSQFNGLLKQKEVQNQNKKKFAEEVEKVNGFIPVSESSGKGGN